MSPFLLTLEKLNSTSLMFSGTALFETSSLFNLDGQCTNMTLDNFSLNASKKACLQVHYTLCNEAMCSSEEVSVRLRGQLDKLTHLTFHGKYYCIHTVHFTVHPCFFTCTGATIMLSITTPARWALSHWQFPGVKAVWMLFITRILSEKLYHLNEVVWDQCKLNFGGVSVQLQCNSLTLLASKLER